MLISREIVRQRGGRRLATGHAGVHKLPDLSQSEKKDVNQTKNPLPWTVDALRTTAAADAISLS